MVVRAPTALAAPLLIFIMVILRVTGMMAPGDSMAQAAAAAAAVAVAITVVILMAAAAAVAVLVVVVVVPRSPRRCWTSTTPRSSRTPSERRW